MAERTATEKAVRLSAAMDNIRHYAETYRNGEFPIEQVLACIRYNLDDADNAAGVPSSNDLRRRR